MARVGRPIGALGIASIFFGEMEFKEKREENLRVRLRSRCGHRDDDSRCGNKTSYPTGNDGRAEMHSTVGKALHMNEMEPAASVNSVHLRVLHRHREDSIGGDDFGFPAYPDTVPTVR